MTTRLRITTVAAFAVLLPGCVSYYRLPEDYSGPTATIENTGKAHDAFKASVFKVSEIDGKLVTASPMQTPYGGGPTVMMGGSSVTIPAGRPLQLKITGGDQFAADGPALIYSMGGNVSKTATETFTFTPEADRIYQVRGELGKKASSVWMEDTKSGRRYP